MAHTEFYCDPVNGNNLNGGSDTGSSPVFTQTNGNWDGTSTFICSASTDISAVTAGMFASVYNDGASAPAVYVARVASISGSGGATPTIVLDTTAKAGTAPTSSATARTIRVGGAWLGPNGTTSFPFGFVTNVLVNTTGNPPRVNLKNNANYSMTGTITHNLAGPTTFRGYTTTAGDGGRATVSGATTGASYTVITLSGANSTLRDIIITNNGATGSAVGFSLTGVSTTIYGCVANTLRGNGFSLSAGGQSMAIECEAYACNSSNAASGAGFVLAGNNGGVSVVRCISHDNTGSNTSGFADGTSGNQIVFIDCISDTNGAHGFNHRVSSMFTMSGCEAYNNSGDGIRIAANSPPAAGYIENCNLIKNGGYGINPTDTSLVYVRNCGFGAGTQANSSGTIATNASVQTTGSVNYANDVTPWIDPANGDFRISLAAAINAGVGAYTETAASYSGTVGYPDIGAAQHLESVATSGGSFTFVS